MKQNNICDDVLSTLRRINRAIELHSKQLIRNYGITSPQLMLLQEISNNAAEYAWSGDLAKSMSLSQATITEMLNRLEKKGYAQRTKSQMDKRRVFITLTDQGKNVLDKAPPLLQERFLNEMTKLQDWEQTALLAALQRIAFMMEAKDIEAAPILHSGSLQEEPEEVEV